MWHIFFRQEVIIVLYFGHVKPLLIDMDVIVQTLAREVNNPTFFTPAATNSDVNSTHNAIVEYHIFELRQ